MSQFEIQEVVERLLEQEEPDWGAEPVPDEKDDLALHTDNVVTRERLVDLIGSVCGGFYAVRDLLLRFEHPEWLPSTVSQGLGSWFEDIINRLRVTEEFLEQGLNEYD